MTSHGSGSEASHSAKSLVQKHFGGQSAAYTRSSLLSDQGNLDTVVRLAEVTDKDRVLDVATGTGFLAAAICRVCREVVATDITLSMLEEARIRTEREVNARFALADVEHLPFAGDSFDLVTCRIALHHFPRPLAALSEMTRVCRPKGRVVIMDIVSSEDEAKSEHHNRMERLRDVSHVKEYRRSELQEMMEGSGLAVAMVQLWPFTWSFDDWMLLGGPDAATAEEVRAMMLDSIEGDKSGLQVQLREGELRFTYTTAIVVARKGDGHGKR